MAHTPINRDAIGRSTAASDSRWPLLLALLASAAAAVLAVQGWRGAYTGLDYDQVINIDEARQLVEDGRLPHMGALASIGAYNPPGTACLIVPGYLTGDPRWFERVGAGCLGVLTLIGVWLLARTCADNRTAALVVAMYALSALGLYFATSLWPRAKPGAFVWMTYFTVLWGLRREARYLAAALIVYAIGMYIFLEMAPAILAIALVWLVYRPPIRATALVVAAVVSLAVWAPHLMFEAPRGFSDIKDQLLLSNVAPDTSAELSAYGEALGTWNPQSETLGEYQPRVEEVAANSLAGRAKKLFFRGFYFGRNLLALFTHQNPLGLIAGLIFLLPLLAWGSQGLRLPERLRSWTQLTWLGVLLFFVAIGANQKTAGLLMGRTLDRGEAAKIWLVEAALVAAGAALVGRSMTARGLERAEQAFAPDRGTEENQPLQMLLLCFVGPWLVQCLAATFVKYCWWLWGLQLVVLGLAASYIPRRRGWPAWSVLALEAVAIAAVVLNSAVLNRVRDWRTEGFAGATPSIVEAADRLAGEIQVGDETAPIIGYLLFFNGYELLGNKIDPRYRIGAPLDQYLATRYGINNGRENAEGVSPLDEYRLVENRPRTNKPNRFRVADQDEFEIMAESGTYSLWKRRNLARDTQTLPRADAN